MINFHFGDIHLSCKTDFRRGNYTFIVILKTWQVSIKWSFWKWLKVGCKKSEEGLLLKTYKISFLIKLFSRWASDIAEEAFASFHTFFFSFYHPTPFIPQVFISQKASKIFRWSFIKKILTGNKPDIFWRLSLISHWFFSPPQKYFPCTLNTNPGHC